MNGLFDYEEFFKKFPVIELGDIRLRDLVASDTPEYYKMMSDPETVQYLSDEDIPRNLEEAKEEVRFWGGLFYRRQSVFWAIAEAQTDTFIGTIGYNYWNIHNQRADVTYDLKKSHWRRGIMNKALQCVVEFGFEKMALFRIEAHTMPGNIASQKLLEKKGFRKEGVLDCYRVVRGKPIDVHLYSLTTKSVQKNKNIVV